MNILPGLCIIHEVFQVFDQLGDGGTSGSFSSTSLRCIFLLMGLLTNKAILSSSIMKTNFKVTNKYP